MAQTIQQQILDCVGEGVSGDIGLTATMMNDWATQGRKLIVSHIPDDKLNYFTLASTATASQGTDISTKRVVRVVRENGNTGTYVECKPVLPSEAYAYSQISTTADPVFYVEGGASLYVLPTPGASPNTYKYYYVSEADVDITNTKIDNFPPSLLPCVVYYVVIHAKLREAGVMRRNAQAAFEALITDYGADSAVSAELTAAKNLLDNDAPAAGDDFYDVLGTDEDVTRARTVLEGVVTRLKKAETEMATLSNDAANQMRKTEGYVTQAARALGEVAHYQQLFNEILSGYIK